ncbi:CocE/NonD family hydrolase, partial [bacterium]|nr:CocE/NonD family hydrolase [bacterium]
MNYEDETAPHWQMLRDAVDVTRVQAPVHLVGGWYDFFLRPLLGDYLRLSEAGREAYLTIGPWHHFSTIARMPDLSLGVGWFDAQLKGEKARLREKPVRLYVMGTNTWRDFDAWPPPAASLALYLQPGGCLSRRAASPGAEPSRYRYDPADPTPALGGTQFGLVGGQRDNRRLERRADVLVFTTSPLQEPVEVIGPVTLTLYVQSSLDYTDFSGRLCDVHPDGRSINLCDGLFRVKPGRGLDYGDGTRQIEIDLWATAHCFKVGHAIRLHIASGAHPRWSRNLGTGESIAAGVTMRAA